MLILPQEFKGISRIADLVVAPGQSLYVYKDVEQLAIAVVDELPYSLEIVQPKVPIVQSGEMALKVLIHRKEGFNEAITLQFPFRPPGIGTRSTVVVPAGATEAVYPLNAAGNAQIREWPIYVLGSANVNGNRLGIKSNGNTLCSCPIRFLCLGTSSL